MVAIASLSAGTLKFRKFPPSVELQNPTPSEFKPHIAVALGTSEGHLVPIMRVELPDGKILEPDAYRNLHMLEEFEIRNPSEYLHFEVLDVERTKEEKENLVVVAAVDGDNNSGGKRHEKGTTKKTPSTRKGHEENPKYVVIASTSIAVSHRRLALSAWNNLFTEPSGPGFPDFAWADARSELRRSSSASMYDFVTRSRSTAVCAGDVEL